MLCCSCKKNQATNIHENKTDGHKQTDYYCADCYRRLFLSATPSSTKAGVCATCGTTAKEFLSSALVGCGDCYRYLSSVIHPVLVKMQGAETHIGKYAKREDKA